MDAEDRERWRELASYRAKPPGLVSSDRNRKKVFAAGLQQANEFAEASAAAGYATKALPLFYAFGQAMRAFSAAFAEGTNWRISGHGAAFSGRDKLLDSVIEPQDENSPGTIQLLSKLDGSKMPTGKITLGQVWRASLRIPLAAELYDAPPGLQPQPPFGEGHHGTDAHTGIITFALPQVSAAATSATDLELLINSYPVLAELGATSAVGLVKAPQYAGRLQRVGEHAVYVAATPRRGLPLPGKEWAHDAPVVQLAIHGNDLETYAAFYDMLKLDGSQPLLPGMGGASEPGWLFVEWARLYALSNIVRYYPAEWMEALDLDSSLLAVPLQRLSDDYEKWLPMMLLSLMEGKAAPPVSTGS